MPDPQDRRIGARDQARGAAPYVRKLLTVAHLLNEGADSLPAAQRPAAEAARGEAARIDGRMAHGADTAISPAESRELLFAARAPLATLHEAARATQGADGALTRMTRQAHIGIDLALGRDFIAEREGPKASTPGGSKDKPGIPGLRKLRERREQRPAPRQRFPGGG